MTGGDRAILITGAARFAGIAAFPRLARRLRWPTRLGPRGIVVYVAATALHRVLIVAFSCNARRASEETAWAKVELAQHLRREPTDSELADYLEVSGRTTSIFSFRRPAQP